MDVVIYNKIKTEADRIIAAIGGGGANLEDIDVYVGDYANDAITITIGARDRYYRRIYGT